MNRLLILSCSQRKRTDPGEMPAIDRYDGPAFRVLRRYLRERPTDPPEVHILSAEFGLIPADSLIPYYDRRMTAQRAIELQSQVGQAVRVLAGNELGTIDAGRLLVAVGRDYLAAFAGCDYDGPGAAVFARRNIPGGQGRRLAYLRDWLFGAPLGSTIPKRFIGRTGPVCFRGVELSLSSEDVLALARRAMGQEAKRARRFSAWYVPLDAERIAPKWLVSLVTGLPLEEFTTGEARTLLSRLCVDVRRVDLSESDFGEVR